ncbi:MAG: response regulator transcription factor, partial [Dolichospermum sp.]
NLTKIGSYDLLILDWMLPGKTGLEICQELRSQGKTTPVLFLTAKDTLDDRVQGLDAGADDYLVKPFELRELLARVRALLRRAGTESHSNITGKLIVGDLELDIQNQIAYRHGRIIELSQKESQLLQYFMENTGQLLTHAQILQHLWQHEEQPNSNV